MKLMCHIFLKYKTLIIELCGSKIRYFGKIGFGPVHFLNFKYLTRSHLGFFPPLINFVSGHSLFNYIIWLIKYKIPLYVHA